VDEIDVVAVARIATTVDVPLVSCRDVKVVRTRKPPRTGAEYVSVASILPKVINNATKRTRHIKIPVLVFLFN